MSLSGSGEVKYVRTPMYILRPCQFQRASNGKVISVATPDYNHIVGDKPFIPLPDKHGIYVARSSMPRGLISLPQFPPLQLRSRF